MLCKIWSSVVFRQTVFLEHYRRSYESTLVSVGVLHLIEDVGCPCLLVDEQCIPVLCYSIRNICVIEDLAPQSIVTLSLKASSTGPYPEPPLITILIMSVILRHSDLQPLIILSLVNHCQRVAVLPSFHRESAAV